MQSVFLPLDSSSFYSYTCSLEGQSYIITIRWNERAESWMLDLSSSDNTSILTGIRLVPYYYIARDYALENLSGFFYLEPKSEQSLSLFEISPRLLYQYFNLFYLFED